MNTSRCNGVLSTIGCSTRFFALTLPSAGYSVNGT